MDLFRWVKIGCWPSGIRAGMIEAIVDFYHNSRFVDHRACRGRTFMLARQFGENVAAGSKLEENCQVSDFI